MSEPTETIEQKLERLKQQHQIDDCILKLSNARGKESSLEEIKRKLDPQLVSIIKDYTLGN